MGTKLLVAAIGVLPRVGENTLTDRPIKLLVCVVLIVVSLLVALKISVESAQNGPLTKDPEKKGRAVALTAVAVLMYTLTCTW